MPSVAAKSHGQRWARRNLNESGRTGGIVEDFAASQKCASSACLPKAQRLARKQHLSERLTAEGLGYSSHFGYPCELAFGTVVVQDR